MKFIDIDEVGEKEAVSMASRALLEGNVIVIPTDTVYGLAADATNKKAVSKVFGIKGRKPDKALPIFVSSMATAKKLAFISAKQESVIKKMWPGKITFVLESRDRLAKETGTQKTIGLRQPDYRFVSHILKATKLPLTGTSANLAGKEPLRDAVDVALVFEGKNERPDIVFSAGKLPASRPSKVIDITGDKKKIVRE